jgi:phosphoribosylformimino-5-aminoimidazole carboxamide ribonucleotide (ProFAR) isomerase
VVDSLGDYHVDEIVILRPVREDDSLASFESDLRIIRSLKTQTPISFGGGIRTLEYLLLLKDLPIERLVLSSAFIQADRVLIEAAVSLFGKQAIQCLLPLQVKDNRINVFNSSKAEFLDVSELNVTLIDDLANEVIIYDTNHDGLYDSFDHSLLLDQPFSVEKLIVSGGIGLGTSRKVSPEIGSLLVDNRALHKEYAIKGYRNAQ